MDHWLEREIAQWVHPIAPWANTLTKELHLDPQICKSITEQKEKYTVLVIYPWSGQNNNSEHN